MTTQPHFPRMPTLSIVSILLIIAGAALCPVFASSFKGETKAERYVLSQLHNGETAEFFPDTIPKANRTLTAAFIEKLLTGGYKQVGIKPNQSLLMADWMTYPGISIRGAVITGDLKLIGQEVSYDLWLLDCTFEGFVELTDSRFAKRLIFTRSRFEGPVSFFGATIGLDLHAENSHFADGATFNGMRVGRNFRGDEATFDGDSTSFDRVQVGGLFDADGAKFLSKEISFDDMRVDGDFSVRDCAFSYREGASRTTSNLEEGESKVSFIGARFADVFLNDSTFDTISTIDFTRMHADFISFDRVKSLTPSNVKLQRMTFKVLSPVNSGQLEFLFSNYNAEFYTDLETSWRTHGYPDEADNIFIAKKRAERRENCKSFLHQCGRFAWAGSMFQDMLIGYGKSLKNLFYWSLGFLIIGVFVFRREKGMRTKDRKDAPHYAGRYQAFWYSLDLFLPIIKLGEAETWTPKDNRRWAILYKKVHIIIGSLFVPIGLAA